MTDMIKRNLLRVAQEGRIGLLRAQVRYLNTFAGHILQQMVILEITAACEVVFIKGVIGEQRTLFTIDTNLSINICDLN